MANEAVSELPGPRSEQKQGREKHRLEVLTVTPQKKILKDAKIEEQKVYIKRRTSWPKLETTNECLQKEIEESDDGLETTEKCFACVTTLQKENYGTDAEVVAFGCMRSVVGGILDGHLCDTCFKMA